MDADYFKLLLRVIFYGVALAAVVRGDRPLRLAGAAITVTALISPLAQRRDALDQPQYGVMLVDLALLVMLAMILLRDRRWWLVVANAMMLMSVMTHIAGLIGAPINPFIIATARLFWAYGMLAALGVGVVARELHRRDPRRQAEAMVRALVAEHGEARTRAELDRRYLVATDPHEKAQAAELSQALRQLTLTKARDGAM